MTVEGEVRAAAAAPRDLHDAWCVAETNTRSTGKRYAPIPVVPSPFVEWAYEAGGALRVTLRNLRSSPAEATCAVELPAECPARVEPAGPQAVSLPAGGEAARVFRFAGLDRMTEPAGLHIVVGGQSPAQRIPIRLFPAVSNGGFELDIAGDGRPEYWGPYDYSGKLEMRVQYDAVRLDSQVARGGRSSLRIDPVKEGKVSVFPLSTMVFPNTAYRISVWARVPAGGRIDIQGLHWQRLHPAGAPDDKGWQKYEGVFKSGAAAERNGMCLTNAGPTPVWFDDVTVLPEP